MLLQVLGTAAGGGLPQWNCACPGCAGARAHPERRRRHASLAVRADAGRWYIVNATPDIGDQIEDTPALHPGPGARQTPVAGIVLTDAELDHTLGVARLREADGVELVATAPVREALLAGPRLGAVLGPYTELLWRELGTTPLPLGPELEAAAVPVAAKRPRYAAETGDDDPDWVVALVLREPSTGKTLVYGPALAAWPQALQEAAEAADCVIVDGTFWDEDEPVRTGISTRTASGMGHLPIDGSAGTAHRLTGLRARCLYTHLNNTNPLTDPDDDRHKQLADRGLKVAADGMVIEL
ncbi:pyrroloquinoline quinone biosynthesis protein PqqB [Streptomyces phaeochromogenes]|uniref:pyrroloquinoline quinone biosynthesis protein PqqB n=1 Tax=Streptomyces phaeochromogenes TaxID=1923 RepID=UPI00224FC99E|nr:pyrroloquinoline quinone biosynthesis protein PqqB [Streptomyces phaeochromogenes]MCX5598858.1 pyrroloquinoline quinone biosynthesis protein PqqB [Streptomyces phaeochromogenes]